MMSYFTSCEFITFEIILLMRPQSIFGKIEHHHKKNTKHQVLQDSTISIHSIILMTN